MGARQARGVRPIHQHFDTLRIYTHPVCLRHENAVGHPESPARLEVVLEGLRGAGLRGLEWHEAPLATRAHVALAHAPEHVARILDTPLTRPLMLDPDTGMNAHSAEAALRAAGAGVAAVDAVLAGQCLRAFCAVRPPGHHATPDRAMGFCLFNSIAVAARLALAAHQLERVAIVDFDVHHGNGTQDCFEHEPRVMYVSSHQAGIYPGTGLESEHGVGNIHNALLPAGSGSAAFRALWQERLLPALDAFVPQLLLISAGFDAHRADPLANLQLETEDFAWLTHELLVLAHRHAGGRIVSLLEGGYDLAALRESCIAHVRELLG